MPGEPHGSTHTGEGGDAVSGPELWNEMWATHRDEPWSPDPDPLLVAEVEGLLPGRSLDIGCGEGQNAIWLAEHGWRASGIDFAAAAVERAASHASQRGADATFEVGDATTYEPGAQFDLVTFFYVHPPTPAVLGHGSSLLVPGGVLLFVGHDRSDPGMHGQHLAASELTTPAEVAAMLRDLEIERAEVVRHEIALHDEVVPAVSTLVRARRPS